MRLGEAEIRRRLGEARVAYLATVSAHGRPHLVPVTFDLTGSAIVIAVDQKPKSTTNLRRLGNIAANERVAVLAEHYDDDRWSALWWVRATGAPGCSPTPGTGPNRCAGYARSTRSTARTRPRAR